MPRLCIAICCLMMIACDKKSPPAPPVVDTPPTVETITGTERVGWDQAAADTAELNAIGYAIYVDGTRTALAGVTCASAAAAGRFPCTARLPSMSVGAHTLELASFVNDGAILESARSSPLRVTVSAQTTSNRPFAAVLRSGLPWHDGQAADGLESPADIAFAPDGRLFVAERTAIRIVRPPSPSATAKQAPATLIAEPAITLADTLGARGRILALAIDPQFERTRYLFAIYTAPARSGELTFTLARFREVSDTLGDQAVLLDGVAASSSPAAALRFGPDGQLYAAFDDAGDARRRRDAASPNGKVLRLNTDGTTPAVANGAPVYADGYQSPVALDWDPQTATLWVADSAAGGSRFAFYRGAPASAWAGRMVSAATLFERGAAANVGFVTVGPDGAIYYGTARALGRLAPDRAP